MRKTRTSDATGSKRALSLPVRLALTYGLLAAAILLLVVGLTMQLTHAYLTRELDYRLQAVTNEFQEGPARRVRRAEDLEREARAWLAVHPFSPDEAAVVRIADGRVLSAAGGMDFRKVRGARDLLMATTPVWRIQDGPGGRVRAAAVPVLLNERQIGTLVVAASKARLKATEQALTVRVVLATVIGLVLAIGVGYAAARQSVQPLVRMVSQIEAIQATGDLSRRIGHDGPADEVGRLATAFDGMLVRLKETFQSQQRFIADASHELRTPLAVARGNLELLHQEIEMAAARRSLAIATEELDRMARIVDDLLLLARLDEGLSLTQQPVDVELTLREALLRSMLLLPRKTDVKAAPGLHALADPDRLLQVLTNLITNAALHGGEHVKISLVARKDGDQVVISVSDTGPGIPQVELPHIFERFYRGARARAAPGVGLGLAIVASLVQAMNGQIAVRSAPGGGTEFVLRLPHSSSVPSTTALGAGA